MSIDTYPNYVGLAWSGSCMDRHASHGENVTESSQQNFWFKTCAYNTSNDGQDLLMCMGGHGNTVGLCDLSKLCKINVHLEVGHWKY